MLDGGNWTRMIKNYGARKNQIPIVFPGDANACRFSNLIFLIEI